MATPSWARKRRPTVALLSLLLLLLLPLLPLLLLLLLPPLLLLLLPRCVRVNDGIDHVS